jgi:hypothetical protein
MDNATHERERGAQRNLPVNEAAEILDDLSMQDRRRAKIDEYEEAAVSRSDPSDAVAGMGNANLLRVTERLTPAVLETLDSEPPTIDVAREIAPVVRLMIRVQALVDSDRAMERMEGGRDSLSYRKKGIALDVDRNSTDRLLAPKRWSANS